MVNIIRAADLSVVGSNGGAWCAQLGTARPTNPAAAPTGAWLAIGAISDDGLTNGIEEDSESFTPWGQVSPFRTVTTSSVRTFSFTAWETNRPIVRSLHNRIPVVDLIPDVDGIVEYVETATPTPDRRSWLFDVYDGETWERFYVPEGEITERSDVTYAQGEMVGYEWTISTYPDALGALVYHAYLAPAVGEHLS
ncbi:hypothetical protein [Streptosporangium sp. CA-115845]|uniref:phage tail tube protein n=1 Tax=Streptosporangium sp. CA-115845 TaxID=3240071 RepID=UPI003D92BD4A